MCRVSRPLRYKHLPHRKGLVSGLIVGGFGAGSFFFNFVVTGIINPTDADTTKDGYYDDPTIYNRVPLMYRVLGTAFLILGLSGAALQRPPVAPTPEFASLLQNAASGAAPKNMETKEEELQGKTTKELFLDPLSWVLMFSLFSTAVGGMYMSSTYK